MKNLFIGIDFSKKKIDVAFFERSDMQSIHSKCFINEKDGFIELISWINSKTIIPNQQWLFCGEHTGLYSYSLSEYLTGKGYFIWLDSPLQIKLSMGIRRGKSDHTDAIALAMYAFRFQDKAIGYKPLYKGLQSLQMLFAFRKRLLRMKNSLLCSAVELRKIMQRDKTARFIYEQTQKDVDRLNKEIKSIEIKMQEIIDDSQELSENYKLVTSIKGIAQINTVAILIYTGNFTRFDNCRQYASYVGVVPFGKDSGTSIHYKPRISKIANGELKSILTQAARCAVMYDPELKHYYQRKASEGKVDRVIINNVRNKLIHRVFAVIRNRKPYEIKQMN